MSHPSTRWSTARRGLPVFLTSALLGSLVSLAPAQDAVRVTKDDDKAKVVAPKPGVATRPETPRVRTVDAPEVESPLPFELRADPKGGTAPGDSSGTTSITDYLKGNPYRLSFVAGDYTPPVGQKIDPELAKDWRMHAHSKTSTFGYIMFQGRITAAKLDRVKRLGVQFGDFHTFQSYQARIPYTVIPRLLGSEDVRWIGYARVAQKIHPEVAAEVAADPSAKRFLFVNVFASDMTPAAQKRPMHDGKEVREEKTIELVPQHTIPNGPIQRALEAQGARIVDYYDGIRAFMLELPLANVTDLAKLDVVTTIELCQKVTHDHDRSTRQIGVDRVRSSSLADGSNAILGILDSGAYMGGGRHRDLNKFGVGWNFGGSQSVWNDTNSHGTHVLGTMCGTGTANNKYRGCAPAAGGGGTRRIFVGRIFDASNYPNNLPGAYDRFRRSYSFGGSTTQRPHVVNNSYGYGSRSTRGYPGTDTISRSVDQHVYLYGQNYVFSNSNTGGTSFSNEYLRSARRPNVAKNAFSVGSQLDYTTDVGRVWYSSGKGPTRDGRLKPNIIAPGRWVRSCRTLTTSSYSDKSGTSMAAPHITGVAAGLVDHYASVFAYKPAAQKAWMCANANPRNGSHSWSSTSQSYYYRQGLGQVDAYKTHYQLNNTNGWTSGWASGTLTSRSAGASFDVTVPADATRTFFVLNFDEKESGSGATRACLADLDLYLDVDGNQSGFNTGEYSSRRAWDTWDWYGNIGSIARVRGKKIRVKIYPRVRPGSSTAVKWGVGYVFQRARTTALQSSLTLSGSTLLRPNQTGTLSARVNVPEGIQTNSYVEIASTGGHTMLGMNFRNPENLLRSYPPIAGVGDSIFNWTLGHLGYFYSSTHRTMNWTFRKATNGSSTICVRLRSDNRSGTTTACRTICVDGLAPNTVPSVRSLSHIANRWSRSTSLRMAWNTVADNGCAGLAGYATRTNLGSAVTPTRRNLGTINTQTIALAANTRPYYFTIRGVDRINNFSARTVSSGPYYVDNIAPTLTSVVISSGLTYTRSRTVTINTGATDAHSGVNAIRFSGDGRTWSPWRAIARSYSFDLASYGGGTAQGTKRVYAQVQDRAGNVSSVRSDSIIYDSIAPIVSFVRINNGAAYTSSLAGAVQMSATGGATAMRFTSNGSTWGPWQTYTTANRSYNLSSFGGNTAFGTKTVYGQARDAAGNTSAARRDTINYIGRPALTTLSPSTLTVVNKTRVRLTGSKLSTVTGINFGASRITSRSDTDWARGYFRIVSNTAIDLYVPQGLAPADYPVRVFNPGFTSASVNCKIVHNRTPYAGSPARTQRGRVLDIKVHRGNQPATVLNVLMISASGRPLNLPGVVSLGMGGNAATIIDPSLAVLAAGTHDVTTHTASYPVPIARTLPAVRLYFESLFIDTLNPNRMPIPSSGATSTQLF